MSCNFNEKAQAFKENLLELEQLINACLAESRLSTEEAKQIGALIRELNESFKRFRHNLIEMLKYFKTASNAEVESLLSELRTELLEKSISEILKEIDNEGYRAGKNENLKKAFERNKFKILENARLEKFDQVIYVLERVFLSADGENLPKKLIELLAEPAVPAEVKKSAVYLYLAAFEKRAASKKDGG